MISLLVFHAAPGPPHENKRVKYLIGAGAGNPDPRFLLLHFQTVVVVEAEVKEKPFLLVTFGIAVDERELLLLLVVVVVVLDHCSCVQLSLAEQVGMPV